jgi:hypothetical protein
MKYRALYDQLVGIGEERPTSAMNSQRPSVSEFWRFTFASEHTVMRSRFESFV